jgi:hypothetical protein
MAENNPYDSQSISNYNSSPPADDGSQVASNALTWAKHIDKIGDPLNTFAAAINTETLGAFSELAMTTDPGEETVVIAMQEFSVR